MFTYLLFGGCFQLLTAALVNRVKGQDFPNVDVDAGRTPDAFKSQISEG